MTTGLKAEVIAIGTELIIGEVINSNATWLSQQLSKVGIDIYYHTAVGDNPARIQGVLKAALSRSNILLITGGLGPTQDDLTVATIADLFGTPLVADTQSEAIIQSYFAKANREMSPSNLKQALRPQSAQVIPNRMGTAPGIFWDVSEMTAQHDWGEGLKLILTFPGIPREMKSMWQERALPMLAPYLQTHDILVTRFLKFFGIGESLLAEKLTDLMQCASPTVSPYVGQGEVKIRIACKALTQEAALAQIAPIEAEILNRAGPYYFGRDDDTMENIVADLLKKKNLCIAVAESCTGGLLSSRLTDIAGSSAYTQLNYVTYANAAKISQLGVKAETLSNCGAVSEAVACEMARGACLQTGADIGIAITGIAGPDGGTEEKPVGLAYIGLCRKHGVPIAYKIIINAQYDRAFIKYWFTQHALNRLRLYLLEI